MAEHTTKKTRPFGATVKNLWKHMGPHRRLYTFGMGLGVVDAICQASIPLFFRYVLNDIQTDASAFMAHHFVGALTIGIAVTIGFFPAAYFFHVLVTIALARFGRLLRTSLYEHVSRLSADFFQRNRVGEITARMNNDLDVVTGSMGMFMALLWSAVVLVQGMAMMFWINAPLAAIMSVMLIIVVFFTKQYLPKIRRMSRNVRDAVGAVSATVTEYLAIHDLIRSFSKEEVIDEKVDRSGEHAQKQAEYFTWRQHAFVDILQVLINFVAPMTLLFIGGWMLSKNFGHLRMGDLVAFWGYWIMLGGAVRTVSNTFAQMFAGLASADRIFDFFDETPLIKDAPNAKAVPAVKGEIVFENVEFRYPLDSETIVLKDFTMHIPAGRRVALVGPSGAGKSTILLLVLRFYDPVKGLVRIDGTDLRDLAQASLREHIGVVMQESVFFAGTIAENLRLAKENATDDQMRDALRNANALDFIESMAGGLNAVLGERGVKLSGGQKQRLSIARVFLKDPPILLFDEATSALDSVSENLVQDAMERLMKNRTAVVVAHRISTVSDADIIYVLDDGCIQAEGKHEELLEKNVLYRQLCLQQGLVA